jgi:hypothetical protein
MDNQGSQLGGSRTCRGGLPPGEESRIRVVIVCREIFFLDLNECSARNLKVVKYHFIGMPRWPHSCWSSPTLCRYSP